MFRRPIIIIAEKNSLDVTKIPAGVQRNKANNAFKKAYLVAPIFSCSCGDMIISFGLFLTSQIKKTIDNMLVYVENHKQCYV